MLLDRKSPCIGCDKRAWDCHGKCKKYLEFKKKLDKERIKIQQNVFYNKL